MDEEVQKLKKVWTDQIDDGVVHISEATKRDGEYTTPYPIGYRVFDGAIKGGVRAGDLIVVTGLSGDGKTTLCQNISVNLSKAGNSCLWFSYEVLIDNVYAKFKEMGCDTKALKIFTPKQMTSGNLEWVEQKIKEGVDKYNSKFIFIDHLDFLAPKKKIKSEEQYRIVMGEIIKELKDIAINLEITIFLVAHVNKVYGRAVEMQDMAECSKIYKLADIVMSASRNSFYKKDISGQKILVYGNNSTARFLKNRPTGQCVSMDYILIDNVISPMGMQPMDFGKNSNIKNEEEEGVTIIDYSN